MTKFFKKSKDPIFIRHLQNEYEKNNIFESYFASLVNDVSRKYVAHLGSQEYKDYHSILNNESLINDWVSMQGLRAVENFFSQYSHYHNLTSNEVARIELDTTVFRGVINIDKTIIFDDYEFLIIEENSKINLKNNANLIIKSGIHIRGTELNPVKIFNSDSSSSSLLVLNAKTNSLVSNTHFYNLSSLSEGIWNNTSAVTFYNSDVKITNSKFYKNIEGDDALNIVSTGSYHIHNCSFSNILSDAIDIDYSNGLIEKSIFENIGNDAIDFSGSNSKVNNCVIERSGDKGVSAGEGTNLEVVNTSISESKFGIVSKDLSKVLSINNKFLNNTYDFSAYNKEEYGSAVIEQENSYGANTILNQLGSKINIDGDNLIFKDFNYGIIEN